MKLSKTPLHKTGQSGEFLGKLLGPLPTYGLALIRNVLKLLAKNVLKQLKPLKRLKPLGLRAAASATDAAIHKKMFRSGMHPSDWAKKTNLIISK